MGVARLGALGRARVIAALRFGLFALLFGLATVPIYLVTALAELLAPGAIHDGARVWGRVFIELARAVLGMRLAVAGIVPRGPVIVAGKHQSLYETLALLDILSSPAIVFKRQLLAVPLWRFFARRHNSMPVDREASASALRGMVKVARKAVREARAILIFPEGERVAVGTTPPIKPGVAALYQLLKLAVVPMTLDSGQVWPKSGLPRAGTVTMRFLEPIAPGLEREAFEARLHAALNGASA